MNKQRRSDLPWREKHRYVDTAGVVHTVRIQEDLERPGDTRYWICVGLAARIFGRDEMGPVTCVQCLAEAPPV
jgi:hypothetical protein